MNRNLFKIGIGIVIVFLIIFLDYLSNRAAKGGNLEMDLEQKREIITPVEKPTLMYGVDEEFARDVDEFIQVYHPALVELAK